MQHLSKSNVTLSAGAIQYKYATPSHIAIYNTVLDNLYYENWMEPYSINQKKKQIR